MVRTRKGDVARSFFQQGERKTEEGGGVFRTLGIRGERKHIIALSREGSGGGGKQRRFPLTERGRKRIKIRGSYVKCWGFKSFVLRNKKNPKGGRRCKSCHRVGKGKGGRKILNS